jgi:hypothetical protein
MDGYRSQVGVRSVDRDIVVLSVCLFICFAFATFRCAGFSRVPALFVGASFNCVCRSKCQPCLPRLVVLLVRRTLSKELGRCPSSFDGASVRAASRSAGRPVWFSRAWWYVVLVNMLDAKLERRWFSGVAVLFFVSVILRVSAIVFARSALQNRYASGFPWFLIVSCGSAPR